MLAKLLRGVDLADTAAVAEVLRMYDLKRIGHTTSQVEQAYGAGQLFHHTPPEGRAERDRMLDETSFLQDMVGDGSPREIVAQLVEMGEDRLAPAGR